MHMQIFMHNTTLAHARLLTYDSSSSVCVYVLCGYRLREFGVPLKEIDLLDEAKLSAEQMKGVMAVM